MSFHFNTFAVALLMSGVAALLMSLVIFQRTINAVKWFSVMMLSSAIWAIGYAFELSSHTLEQMLFWIDLEYLGIAIIPAAWIVFIIKFIGRDEWLSLRNRLLIFFFPAVTLLMVWTNHWHHIQYEKVSVDTYGPFPMLAITPGPWYHVHTVYFYFLLAWGLFLLFNKFRKANTIYKKQNISILIGALIPWIVNVIYLLGIRPYQHLDLTPYAFILTSIVIGFGLMRFKLFDVVPLAREKVLAAIQEGVLILDIQGRVIDQNATMEKFLHQYSSSTVGRHFDEIMTTEYKLHLLISKRVIDNLDIKLKDKMSERFFEVAINPLFEKETVFSGTLLIFWDITERKHAEEKFKKQADELLILNQLKDKMFSIISHDIRSPMASLKGILTIAEDGVLSEEEFKSFLPLLSNNVGYTYDLLDNLLHWSRSQLQGETLNLEEFDLKSLIREKIMLFEKKALEKKIRLEDLVADPTLLLADKNMIRLVLHNLLANAIKFCNVGDVITLSAKPEGEKTLVSVKDTGIGMDTLTMSKLFEFGTITTPGTQGEKGTGLGLILCKDFVEKHNGKIWVESTPGKGSEFFFQL